jgi:hypothetical protein
VKFHFGTPILGLLRTKSIPLIHDIHKLQSSWDQFALWGISLRDRYIGVLVWYGMSPPPETEKEDARD